MDLMHLSEQKEYSKTSKLILQAFFTVSFRYHEHEVLYFFHIKQGYRASLDPRKGVTQRYDSPEAWFIGGLSLKNNNLCR